MIAGETKTPSCRFERSSILRYSVTAKQEEEVWLKDFCRLEDVDIF